jgi:CubicO group peptidase (beta-lactamase class C family)
MRLAAVLAFACFLEVSALAADTDERAVDRVFDVYDKAGSPGCALGVIRDGAFVYRKGYGAGSLELGVPLSTQSVFYMGSVSKQFTAASVVLAAEQGFLSLDDNIRKYIPEIPDYGQPITLRQMLHHTSGFRDVLGLLDLSGRKASDVHPTDELLDLVARQKALNFAPGGEYLYSNTNYFLLAEVVTRSTKKPLSVFAAENIFQPLGMTHTQFYDDHTAVVPGRVAAYARGKNGSFVVDWSTNFDKVGDGGLMSSVDDLLLWDRNFYQNQLGKGTLLKELQTRGVLNNGKQIDYALGLRIGTYRGLPIVEHGGALFGYRTEILRFPEDRFTVLCLCNLSSADPSALSRKVADVYLEKRLQPAATPTPSSTASASDPGAFAGKYFNKQDHSSILFERSGANLVVGSTILRPLGGNRFQDPGGAIVVFESSDGVMKASISRGGEVVISGVRIEEVHYGDAELATFVGMYTSKELDATYKLWVEKGSLMARSNWNPPLKLTPIVQDEFEGAIGTMVFHRDANGRISGLGLYQGRVRDVTFEKAN